MLNKGLVVIQVPRHLTCPIPFYTESALHNNHTYFVIVVY